MPYEAIERWEWEGGALAPQPEPPQDGARDAIELQQEPATPDDAARATAGSARGGSRSA